MINFGNIRNERINKLQRRLERVEQSRKSFYTVAELPQFYKTEGDVERLKKELEIQKAYKQLEQENGPE
jgi:hypothetical protein